MNILLLFDKDFHIEKNAILDFLNSNVEFLRFELGEDINIETDILTKPKSFNLIARQLDNPFKKFQRVFCFTEKPYDDNFFIHEHNLLSIFSFWQWSYLTNLPYNNGVVYFIIDYLALEIDESGFRHHELTGCIYDFLWSKDGVDNGMRQAIICPTCLARVNNNLTSESQIRLLNDLKTLMNLLSNSSKWNQDILSIDKKAEKKILKRKSKKTGEINVVIASPGDTQSERRYLLDRLEIQFRRGNHESHCSKRLIVHGWEDIASQNGYPQDTINSKIIENMDFVIAVFKHKLGTPTLDNATGIRRAESGTAEELLQALDNSKKNKSLGMAYFFSKAPVISLDSPDIDLIKNNWDRLEAFKSKIQNKMIYKPYTESTDLLQTIILDLERNIIDYFE